MLEALHTAHMWLVGVNAYLGFFFYHCNKLWVNNTEYTNEINNNICIIMNVNNITFEWLVWLSTFLFELYDTQILV